MECWPFFIADLALAFLRWSVYTLSEVWGNQSFIVLSLPMGGESYFYLLRMEETADKRTLIGG